MRKSAIALAALGVLSAVTAAAPAPAEAHGWDRGRHGEGWRDHHRNNGAAVAFGIIGGILAGAAIASSHPYAAPAYAYPPASYYGTPYGYAGYGYYR